jgi:hypothetical protein
MKEHRGRLKTAVRESRVLNRSIAFWDPDHPSATRIRASIRSAIWAFLGGMAPAIPGMGRLKFSADEDDAGKPGSSGRRSHFRGR